MGLDPGEASMSDFDEMVVNAKKNPPKVKTCLTCGIVHIGVPKKATKMDDGSSLSGFYWDCACGSTLFSPLPAAEKSGKEGP